MVATLITLVGLIGLLKAINLALEHNMRNQLREEATVVADRAMANLKVRAFTQLSTPHFSSRTVPSQLRSGTIRYTLGRDCTVENSTTMQLKVTVGWTYRGVPYTYSVTSIRAD